MWDKGYKGFGVDVWSSGVVLFSMLYGSVPFKGSNMSELHKLIIEANYTLNDDISEGAWDLLKWLLETDPAKRIKTEQILSHPWVSLAPKHLSIFTETEKKIIAKEFTYNDTRWLNWNQP